MPAGVTRHSTAITMQPTATTHVALLPIIGRNIFMASKSHRDRPQDDPGKKGRTARARSVFVLIFCRPTLLTDVCQAGPQQPSLAPLQ